jgi:hypothetical protein
MSLLLVFGYFFQRLEERRIRDGGGFCATDQGFALGSQGCDGEGHSDAVVAEGVEFGAVEGLASGNLQAVFAFFDLRAHEPEIGGDGCDAIRFLHA